MDLIKGRVNRQITLNRLWISEIEVVRTIKLGVIQVNPNFSIFSLNFLIVNLKESCKKYTNYVIF